MLELDPNSIYYEVAINDCLAAIAPAVPRAQFAGQDFPIRNTAVSEALAAQHTRFNLGHLKPTVILGRVMDLSLPYRNYELTVW